MELAPFHADTEKQRPCSGCRGFKGPCPSTPRDANGICVAARIAVPLTESNRNLRLDLELSAHPGMDPAEVPVAARRHVRRRLRDRIRVPAVDQVVAQDARVPR